MEVTIINLDDVRGILNLATERLDRLKNDPRLKHMFAPPPPDDFYAQMRARFENNIECPDCHNKNWEQFIYFQWGNVTSAGCKQCSHIQEFKR